MHAPLGSRRPNRRVLATRAAPALLAATALVTPFLLSAPATAATPASAPAAPTSAQDREERGEKLARELVRRTGAKGATRHLKVLRAVARAADDNRAAGSRGHELSARYAGTLLKSAGYDVTYQDVEFTFRETLAEKLTVQEPGQRDVSVKLMTYTTSTPEGGIEAALAEVPVDKDDSTGCDAGDYEQATDGGGFGDRIALIRRGGCTFAQKQDAAADAGAAGALIYNNTDGVLNGTLGSPDAARVPTGGISKADGEKLAAEAAEDTVRVTLELREFQEERTSPNVIAETPGGDPDNVVMFGAHLDSVADGPGINDNGSGSAGILETALRFGHAAGGARSDHTNKVRFALWTAEELGLKGSEWYVDKLSPAEREQIALYLNFDMIASPNAGLFVYDGDDSDGVGSGPGPEGSGLLERNIQDFIASRGEESRGTDFTGRSDYGPFIAEGIPSGGTFTGAEGIKTEEERDLWGGEAGEAYDACYHQACDDLDNIDPEAFDVNVKVIADAVGRYAWSTDGLE